MISLNIDISHSGFVRDFFDLVEFVLNGALGFANTIVMVMTSPIISVLESITDSLPDLLDWPFRVIQALIYVFADDADKVSVITFVFSSAIIFYIAFVFVRFVINTFNIVSAS